MTTCSYATCDFPSTNVADGWPFCRKHLAAHRRLTGISGTRNRRTPPPAPTPAPAVATRPTCGTRQGAERHRRHNEPLCDVCRESERLRNRVRYARAKGVPLESVRPREPVQHGTRNGYQRHLRQQNVPCEPCRQAENEYNRRSKAARRKAKRMPTGYRAPDATKAAGITYRQVDYWASTGLIEPSIVPAAGSGTQRLYSHDDIVRLATCKALLDAGVTLETLRAHLPLIEEQGYIDTVGDGWQLTRITVNVPAISAAVDRRINEHGLQQTTTADSPEPQLSVVA